MSDQHTSVIKTPKQLIIVVLLAFVVPVTLIILVAQLVTGHRRVPENSEAVLQRIKPVGELKIAEASGPRTLQTGQQVFQAVCSACHGTGAAGAPKAGDKAAWGPLIKEGFDHLVSQAIKGVQEGSKVMPPKGGNADLDDVEVARAVAYMANQAGANFKEPEPKAAPAAPAAAAPAAAATAAPAPAAPATPAKVAATPAAAVPATSADKGKSVFEGTCNVCHGTGVAGAPKAGDKAAWGPRIAQGKPALYNSALHGKNAMPPKGGNNALSDDDVKAAVDYMVGLAK
jgi:cytochrome c5